MARQATREEYGKAMAQRYVAKHGTMQTVGGVATPDSFARRASRREDGWANYDGLGKMTDSEILAELGIADEATDTTNTSTDKEDTKMDKKTNNATKATSTKATKATSTKAQTKKEATKMVGQRANRVVVRAEGEGFVAEFFKTHKSIATVASTDTNWTRNKDHNPTQAREDFRTWVQANADQFGVAWIPELQEQAWERKYWKYETDAQVEEDAIELMKYTINKLTKATGYDQLEVKEVKLDAIIPNKSELSYIEHGKYTKNGNWAVATVNLAVVMEWMGTQEEIIYPIEMRSGQLTKIKMNNTEFKAMVAEVFDADIEAQKMA